MHDSNYALEAGSVAKSWGNQSELICMFLQLQFSVDKIVLILFNLDYMVGMIRSRSVYLLFVKFTGKRLDFDIQGCLDLGVNKY